MSIYKRFTEEKTALQNRFENLWVEYLETDSDGNITNPQTMFFLALWYKGHLEECMKKAIDDIVKSDSREKTDLLIKISDESEN